MRNIIKYLTEHNRLSKTEAYDLINNIVNEYYNEYEIASILTCLNMRNIELDEMIGFRQALLDLSLKIDVNYENLIDLCGTGGDNKNTFNISTISAFVIAGAGYKVAKHGNYGLSSICGSSNILELLGYKFTIDSKVLNRQLNESNLCFIHAPMFHPALKNVAIVRRSIGIKTIFNLLGPIVNPLMPKNQVLGVNSKELIQLYKSIFTDIDVDFNIIYSVDGYDEISLTSDIISVENNIDKILKPSDFGFKKYNPSELEVKNIEDSKNVFLNILNNTSTEAQKNVVIANSAIGIKLLNPTLEIDNCVEISQESIDSGRALQTLKNLI